MAIIVLATVGIFLIACWIAYWIAGKMDEKDARKAKQKRYEEAKIIRMVG